MRMTLQSKGGPRARELITGLAAVYPVYEAGPDVYDVYCDDHAAIYEALDAVTPSWRMYLQPDRGTAEESRNAARERSVPVRDPESR